MKRTPDTRVAKKRTQSATRTQVITPISEEARAIKAVFQSVLARFAEAAGESKIGSMDSYVYHVEDGRVTLYGQNSIEGPVVEYWGAQGSWRCSMTRTLKLKGFPIVIKQRETTR